MAMSPCRTRRPFLSQLTAFLDLDSTFWAWKIFQEAYEPHTIPMHRTLFIFICEEAEWSGHTFQTQAQKLFCLA